MGKFKDYLINEQFGLANLGQKLGDFQKNQWLDTQIGGAFGNKDNQGQPIWRGTGPESIEFPSELTIPSFERTGRITQLETKRNPILIRLSDGTEAYFTYDEYRRIKGKPAIGKTMTIVFERHPKDWTKNSSKINQIIVRD